MKGINITTLLIKFPAFRKKWLKLGFMIIIKRLKVSLKAAVMMEVMITTVI